MVLLEEKTTDSIDVHTRHESRVTFLYIRNYVTRLRRTDGNPLCRATRMDGCGRQGFLRTGREKSRGECRPGAGRACCTHVRKVVHAHI